MDFRKKQVVTEEEVDFILFFNSRNIRRKQIPDAMVAFRAHLDALPFRKSIKM